MRVLFFGTPAFAVPALRAVAASRHRIAAVVTGPARPRGRGLARIEPSPVAAAAAGLDLPVLTPARLTGPDFLAEARALAPDAIALAAYGKLVPPALLAMPPKGPWNVHPSLLPRWRGVAPIHRALLAGDAETGVCLMRMTTRLDAGPVALVERTPVGPRETRGELEARLAALGAALLVRGLDALEVGTLPARPQDEAAVTEAPAVRPEETELAWDRPAAVLDRTVRALAPAPGATVRIGDARVKVLAASPAAARGEPGALLARGQDGSWRVACAEGALDVARVQPAGRKPMTMDEFIRGLRLKAGMSLLAAGAPA